MRSNRIILVLCALFVSNVLADEPAYDEIFVTAAKKDTPVLELAGNTARLSADRIRITNGSQQQSVCLGGRARNDNP